MPPLLKNMPEFLLNHGRIVCNQGQSLLLNMNFLKLNAFMVSAAVLVGSRIVVSAKTAVDARGTKDENYREMEFLKTATREVLGWISSYGLLRAFQCGLRTGLKWVTGAESNPALKPMLDSASYGWWQDLRSQWANVGKANFSALAKVHPFQGAAYNIPVQELYRFNEKNWLYRAVTNMKMLGGQTAPERMARFMEGFPLALGFMVSLGISGFLLEYVSLKYPEAITGFLKNLHQSSPLAKSAPVSAKPSQQQPEAVVAPAPSFSYLDRGLTPPIPPAAASLQHVRGPLARGPEVQLPMPFVPVGGMPVPSPALMPMVPQQQPYAGWSSNRSSMQAVWWR
ncbi:MAG: hypothetical protein SFZ03_04665 [Candidatus Melainabacteria bacterium]|nr:hypothetical protein [Candidatus Melainabacteria bacterium]